MSYNDIVLTCAFCGRHKKFAELDQVCLRPLTIEEKEKFKAIKIKILKLEFAIRCNKCKENGKATTLNGYSVATTPVGTLTSEEIKNIAVEREINRYKASLFKKGRK
jgi:hypothetical protein